MNVTPEEAGKDWQTFKGVLGSRGLAMRCLHHQNFLPKKLKKNLHCLKIQI